MLFLNSWTGFSVLLSALFFCFALRKRRIVSASPAPPLPPDARVHFFVCAGATDSRVSLSERHVLLFPKRKDVFAE